MNEKRKALLISIIILTICWIVCGYSIYKYYNAPVPAGLAGAMHEEISIWFFVVIFLISYIGGILLCYWSIIYFGLLKKKQNV